MAHKIRDEKFNISKVIEEKLSQDSRIIYHFISPKSNSFVSLCTEICVTENKLIVTETQQIRLFGPQRTLYVDEIYLEDIENIQKTKNIELFPIINSLRFILPLLVVMLFLRFFNPGPFSGIIDDSLLLIILAIIILSFSWVILRSKYLNVRIIARNHDKPVDIKFYGFGQRNESETFLNILKQNMNNSN